MVILVLYVVKCQIIFFLCGHCEEKEATEGSFLRRSNPVADWNALGPIGLLRQKLLRFAAQFSPRNDRHEKRLY
jgi:hypothetical protein